MKCHVNGLTLQQWIMCLVISLSVFIVNFILKFVPDSICPTLGDEDPEDVKAAAEDYLALRKLRQ